MDKAALKAYKNDLKERFTTITFDNSKQNLALLIDKETGLEYLETGGILSDFHAITPLYNTDGSPKINEKWRDGLL
ncbi:DUF6440 family protein [Streptococcus sp. zg-JUN1979]|uniref:DUF6440 family protein n=1 Tax=Streptococcus sp. zg-JUN1979 TaxID=3391450 RepID=UPI0039A537BB